MPRGSHLLIQARTKVLNEELDQTFQLSCPVFRKPDDDLNKAHSSFRFLGSRVVGGALPSV